MLVAVKMLDSET